MIKLLLKNKVIIIFVLSLIGVTNLGQYLLIPTHGHPEQPKPKALIHKTIINKMDCDSKCKSDIKKLINTAILSHVKADH